jgi:hypothetical protein
MALFTEPGERCRWTCCGATADGKRVKRPGWQAQGGPPERRDRRQSVTLFFHTAARFRKGELLELDIRDVETLRAVSAGRHQADRRQRHVRAMSDAHSSSMSLDRPGHRSLSRPGRAQGPACGGCGARSACPAFVIEFLLGKYCASTDEEAIQRGPGVRPGDARLEVRQADEREAVKSAIKQHTTYEIIDKISVRLVETHDKYWAGCRTSTSTTSTSTSARFGARPAADGRHLGRDHAALRRLVRLQGPEPAVLRREHPADPALDPQHRELRRGAANGSHAISGSTC